MNLKTLCSNLLPTSKYKMLVSDIKFAAGGSKSILVTLTVVEGTYAKRNHVETIPEKAYGFKLMPLLKACNVDVDRDFGTAEELYKFAFASCKGKTIEVSMGMRTYNGQDYNNVLDFSPLAGSTVSADDVAESFNAAPEVKGNAIKDVVEEEINIPDSTPNADEPTLDVDLDLESPF